MVYVVRARNVRDKTFAWDFFFFFFIKMFSLSFRIFHAKRLKECPDWVFRFGEE